MEKLEVKFYLFKGKFLNKETGEIVEYQRYQMDLPVNGSVVSVTPTFDKTGLPQGIIFLVGLLLAAPLWIVVTGTAPVQVVSKNELLLVAAGLLVGFGSVIGNGCTSGHGVCGISRGSARSIAATMTFMATAFVTVFVLRHVVGG